MARRKILLLNPPGKSNYLRDYYCSHTSKARYYWGPFDLLVVSGILKDKHDLQAMDCILDEIDPQEAMKRIAGMDVDTIIFLTGAVSWQEDFTFLRDLIKQTGNDYRCIGVGDILFAESEKFLQRYDFLEACIQDFTTQDIAEYFDGEERVFEAVSYRSKSGEIVAATKKFSRGEFTYPIPRYDLFDYERYRFPTGRLLPFAEILTDYGCAYQCTYCIGGKLGFKYRNIDNSLEELRELKRMGVKELRFKDLTFGVNKKHYFELLDRMVEEKFNFSWTCLSRADVLTDDLLGKMKAAGCHTIQMGIESADDAMLKQYKKFTKTNTVREVMKLTKKHGIRVLGHFILGLPGDTEESIEQTIDYAIELDPAFVSFNIAMPRMATSFREEAISSGLVSEDVNLLDNSRAIPVYETNQLTREKLFELRNRAVRRFHLRPSYIAKRLFGARSMYELSTLFREGTALLLSVIFSRRNLEQEMREFRESQQASATVTTSGTS